MTDPSVVLAAIKARCEAATEGKWTAFTIEEGLVFAKPGENYLIGDMKTATSRPGEAHRNAVFIAHARTDVPLLADALQAVLDACDDLERLADLNRIEAERRDESGENSGRAWSSHFVAARAAARFRTTIATALAKGETS